MEQQQNDNSHASAQSRAEGANLTDKLATATCKVRGIFSDYGGYGACAHHVGGDNTCQSDFPCWHKEVANELSSPAAEGNPSGARG